LRYPIESRRAAIQTSCSFFALPARIVERTVSGLGGRGAPRHRGRTHSTQQTPKSKPPPVRAALDAAEHRLLSRSKLWTATARNSRST